MGGVAIQLLRIIRLRQPILEAVNSKVFVDNKKLHFVGQIVKNDGFWDLLTAVCQCHYPAYHLIRLADTREGGIDLIKYYVEQIRRVLCPGLKKIIEKWKAPGCPTYNLKMAAGRMIDRAIGGSKTEGLENEDGDKNENEEGEIVYVYCYD